MQFEYEYKRLRHKPLHIEADMYCIYIIDVLSEHVIYFLIIVNCISIIDVYV